MKRKRIFKFLPLLLLMAGAMFVASCSSDDDMCITGTIHLYDPNGLVVFIGELNIPEGCDQYSDIKTVVVSKDEFPIQHYQDGDVIDFNIVEVQYRFPPIQDAFHIYPPSASYMCSIKQCE